MRIVLSIILVGMLSYHTSAQVAHQIQFGVKAGINYSKLHGSDFESVMQSDWHLGGYMHLRGDRMGLGLEAIYDRGRYEMKNLIVDAVSYHYLGDTSSQNAMLQAHKFQIPIYLMYKISFMRAMFGIVQEINIHLRDREELIRDTESSFEDSYPSLLLGAWVDLTEKMNIGARYLVGIQNVNTSNWDARWRSREAQLHFGIKL